jgi:SAM-dependent MidA family methyltransferase
MSVDRYMEICLHDPDAGYYAVRPGLGEAGDFITAPLVSQMFGELLGIWAAETWDRLGRPPRVRLVELGPGSGVMIGDVLRAARRAAGFVQACELWLVETSAPLRARQAAALEASAPGGSVDVRWATRLEEVPVDAPAIILANEFLDCLPISQAVLTPVGWRRRRIGLSAAGDLTFVAAEAVAPPPGCADAPLGTVGEWSDALAAVGAAVGMRMAGGGGAALFIDYGRDAPGPGDTLQALRRHRKESALANPGRADLTAHVDFPTFLASAAAVGAEVGPIRTQADFLESLGLRVRAAALANARPDASATIARQLHRLTAPDQMGALFKVAVAHQPGLAAPGFDRGP